MAGTIYNDVILTPSNPPIQKCGTIICEAPLGGNPLGVVNTNSEFVGPSPSGVANKYTKRFQGNNFTQY